MRKIGKMGKMGSRWAMQSESDIGKRLRLKLKGGRSSSRRPELFDVSHSHMQVGGQVQVHGTVTITLTIGT